MIKQNVLRDKVVRLAVVSGSSIALRRLQLPDSVRDGHELIVHALHDAHQGGDLLFRHWARGEVQLGIGTLEVVELELVVKPAPLPCQRSELTLQVLDLEQPRNV